MLVRNSRAARVPQALHRDTPRLPHAHSIQHHVPHHALYAHPASRQAHRALRDRLGSIGCTARCRQEGRISLGFSCMRPDPLECTVILPTQASAITCYSTLRVCAGDARVSLDYVAHIKHCLDCSSDSMTNTYPGQYIDVSMLGTSSNQALEARLSELETQFKNNSDQLEKIFTMLTTRMEYEKDWRKYHTSEIETLKQRFASLEQQLATTRYR